MKPEFTDTEKLVISAVRTRTSWDICRDILVVMIALMFAGLAYYGKDYLWLAGALMVLIVHILQNAFATKKYTPVYQAIFDKYDAAIEQSEKNTDPD